MPYRTTVKRLLDGHWQARCLTAPNGIVTVQGDSREQALQKVRDEITYQLEFCPCSAVAQDYVELEVVENAGPPLASPSAKRSPPLRGRERWK